MERKFEDGCVVMLNSGGPTMTVTSFDEKNKSYYCEWFLNNELKSHTFYEHQLSEV